MFIDNQVTRFPGGVNNAAVDDIFNSLKYSDPTKQIQLMEDFLDYVPTAWTVTETQAGATQATASGLGGWLLLTNSAADNDINQIQKTFGSYLPAVGKKFFMNARFKLSDVVESDFAIGIQNVNVDGTDLAVALDGIFFLKADGAATLALYSRQSNAAAGTVNSGTIATLVNDTFVSLSCFWDGVDRLYYSVDGTTTGYITTTSLLIPDALCAPIISLKNGEAVAKTATIDRLFVALER
jgi:hypothetical protein